MPGLDGCALLRELRARGVDAPAVATSAEIDPAIDGALRAAGFVATLRKPAALAEIQALLRLASIVAGPRVPDSSTETAGTLLLDDATALAAAGGDRSALRALRALFSNELADMDDVAAITGSSAGSAAMAERLHRLRASCGICGALRLRDAAARLEAALLDDAAAADEAVRAFADAWRATREALAVDEEGNR